MTLPTDSAERKKIPLYSGLFAYFPDALVAVAILSQEGNDQHNPGTPLHWDRSKSGDELDALLRHIIDGDWDAVAWRALANCQKKIEEQREGIAVSTEDYRRMLDLASVRGFTPPLGTKSDRNT